MPVPTPIDEQPYAPPAASGSGGLVDDPSMIVEDELRRTRPCVLFIAVLGFIGAAFFGVSAIFSILSIDRREAFGGLYMLAIAVMYAVPSVKLISYAGRIKQFSITNSEQDLGQALKMQRQFWFILSWSIVISILLIICFSIHMFRAS